VSSSWCCRYVTANSHQLKHRYGARYCIAQCASESVAANVSPRKPTHVAALTAHFTRSSLGARSNKRDPG